MRFFSALKNDIRFQVKYGFYFLYAFFSAVYTAALALVPAAYRRAAAALIVLTDPALLGVFFIGGIWLLEKGEGLHRFWGISPLRPLEYILAKAISLALLSTAAADLIALAGCGGAVRLGALSGGVFVGAVTFNLLGLGVACRARSVNHYLLLTILPLVLVSVPPVLAAGGWAQPLLELFPGTALWRVIAHAVGAAGRPSAGTGIALFLWLGALLFWAHRHVGAALQDPGEVGG